MVSFIEKVTAKIKIIITQVLRRIREPNKVLTCSSFIELVTTYESMADNTRFIENITTLAANITESTVDDCSASEISTLEYFSSSLADMSTSLTSQIENLREKLSMKEGKGCLK